MIRDTIIELFKRLQGPPTFEAIAAETVLTVAEVGSRLSKEGKLDNLRGLSVRQAFELVEFYGSGAIFTEEIERNISDVVSTKQKIKRIEARKRGSGEPPSAK